MKPVRLFIAVVVLAGVGFLLWWSNRSEAAKEGKPAADASPRILEIKPDQVKQVELKHRGDDKPIVVVFDDQGKWQITSPQAYPADPAAVATITSGVEKLDSERIVDPNVTDLAAYGLAPALTEVTITDKSGKRSKLLIGEDSPTGSATYAKVEGDPRLFTMAASHKSAFEKQLNDLRDKRLFSFTQDLLTKLELTAKEQSVSFAKSKQGDWQIEKPKLMRADGNQVEELITKLHTAQMDLSTNLEGPKAEALFNSGTPIAKVGATDEGGTKSLEIRKNKDEYFAKSSAGTYKTSKDTADALDKSLETLRTKKLFDFGFTDPSHIEITDGAKTLSFDKAGEKWSGGGKTMDNTSVQQFIDKLRDLTATKFVDTGFTTPLVTLSIAYTKELPRKERVEISQAGSAFYARHDGDSSFYELDATAVNELRKSAGDIQPAQPGKKK